MKQLSEQEALYRAAALCSGSEHCVSDIEEKLQRWGVEEDARERIIAHLIDEKYVDEARYARAYAHDKLRYNHWGRVKIDQMLRLQGIADRHRREALSDLPAEEYRDILENVLAQKARSVKAGSDYERRGKLIRFALGRGFMMDEILSCVADTGEDVDS